MSRFGNYKYYLMDHYRKIIKDILSYKVQRRMLIARRYVVKQGHLTAYRTCGTYGMDPYQYTETMTKKQAERALKKYPQAEIVRARKFFRLRIRDLKRDLKKSKCK